MCPLKQQCNLQSEKYITFIVYELVVCPQDLNTDFTLKDFFFLELLTKNAYPSKYSFSGYGIGFDSCSLFLLSNYDWGKNTVICGVYNSSSVHIDNKKR